MRAAVSSFLLAHAVSADPVQDYAAFKAKFDLSFESSEEDALRFKIFQKNMKKVESLNAKAHGRTTFGPTKFSHLTQDEFKKFHTGYKRNLSKPLPPKKMFTAAQKKNLKVSSIDWREIGGVSPVKDQGQCGSCWAFSATQAVETAYWKATNSMLILSPQQTVSCDSQDGGCNGGDTPTAYEYMENAGGLELEMDYPYTSGTSQENGSCDQDSTKFKVKVDSYSTISSGSWEEGNMYQQIQDSPMSICVDAEPWQFYMGGVIDRSTCGTDLDHCVHLVALKAGEYWTVKNSWNTNWGEEGYIRVKSGENACGIAEEATIAVAEDENPWKSNGKSPDYNVVELLEGFAAGFGLPMEEKCVDGGNELIVEFDKAYELMMKKNPIAIAEAMKVIADALKNQAPAAAKACEATKEELDKLLAALEIMKHPKEFAYHVGHDLEVHGTDIFANVNAAVGDYKAKNYRKSGEELGKAMYLLAVGDDEKKADEQVMYV